MAPRYRGARLFTLFAVKVLASLVMDRASTLKPSDREMVLIMERVHSADLADELGFVRTFRYRNDTSIYVAERHLHLRRRCDCTCPQHHRSSRATS